MTARFAEHVEQYVAMRRGLGYRLDRQATYLRSFAAFLDRCGHDGPVPLALSVQWATDTRSPDPHNPARRLSAVGGFLRYLAPLDGATEIPPPGVLGPSHHRTPPHIYSDQEIATLLTAAAELSPRRGLRPECYVTLFALLASTGLRISEALALTREDVDLTEGLVTVRAGKGGKTQLVPLHPSALEPLGAYAAHRDRVTGCSRSGAFFRTDRSEQLTYAAVRGTFKRLRHRLGWTSDGRTRRPRIHDLRHRMVVQRMLAWYVEGADVDAKLPALASFLGHVQISDVYWYFSVTPELMSIVGERFGTFNARFSAGAG
jgi:integrase/recombinase XerD